MAEVMFGQLLAKTLRPGSPGVLELAHKACKSCVLNVQEFYELIDIKLVAGN